MGISADIWPKILWHQKPVGVPNKKSISETVVWQEICAHRRRKFGRGTHPGDDHFVFCSKSLALDYARRQVGNYFARQIFICPAIGLSYTDGESAQRLNTCRITAKAGSGLEANAVGPVRHGNVEN